MISYNEALTLTLDSIRLNEGELVNLAESTGRIAADDLSGLVDSPSVDSSLKDGYAVCSDDISAASEDNSVVLRLTGSIAAGEESSGEVRSGEAFRILSGAQIPAGADAVIAEEFTKPDGEKVIVMNNAHRGRNILPAGSDVRKGEVLVEKHAVLDPMTVGFLAAAGYDKIPVIKKPSVAVISTGDEVIAPGTPLAPGKLYASNLVTIASWCGKFGYSCFLKVVPDSAEEIERELRSCIEKYDVILTSGGAWTGERDLVVKILDKIGWKKMYHRVKIGPGKAAAFGTFNGKYLFCLPGGPPSNHMAFVQLALPALQKIEGAHNPGLPKRRVLLSDDIKGQSDWTQFIHGTIREADDIPVFTPLKSQSRLQMLSNADGIVMIPEGTDFIGKGEIVEMQLLR